MTADNRSPFADPNDENEGCSTPSKRQFGGILASVSHNIPRNGNSKGGPKRSTQKMLSSEILRTPPPKSIEVDGETKIFSPLTQPRPARSLSNNEHGTNAEGDESNPFDEEIDTDVDEDDDLTLERTLVTNDVAESVESEEDELEDESQGSEASEAYSSEEESLSSLESEPEVSEPDDDEYVPDEDEDTESDEDFDDYVEERKPSRSRTRRKVVARKTATPKSKAKSPVKIANRKLQHEGRNDSDHEKATDIESDNRDPMISSIDNVSPVELDEPSVGEPEAANGATIMEKKFDTVGVDKQLDLTPTKDGTQQSNPNQVVPCTPVSLHAVVVEDDEDDDVDDVLVATIIENDNDLTDTHNDLEQNDEPQLETSADSSIDDDTAFHGINSPAPSLDSVPNKSIAPAKQKGSKTDRQSFFRAEGNIKRGKWTLGSKIGVGSFGVVHVGMNNETGKLMAVKKFKVNDSVMKDIRTEVELMRSLRHKNIVRYLGAQMDKSNLHIFQEWVPGGSVASLLSRFGPFGIQVIRSYLSQTLEGLSYLHTNDIMHRDIKGSNILVNDNGVVKLADFGASKKLANLKDDLLMSLTVRGTPYFMAPEVFEEKYSAKADIWGIGCVAHQMITGSPPWKALGFTNPISLFNHVKKHDGRPIIDPENSARLESEDTTAVSSLYNLLDVCFEKNPSRRPSASELLQHQFFLEVHDDADDETVYSRGLFSPYNDARTSWISSPSPKLRKQRSSESPAASPRRLPLASPKNKTTSKSVVQWKKTFVSPQRPKRGLQGRRRKSRKDVMKSPKPDTKDWPEWAREEIRRKDSLENAQAPFDEMGSLALSADSASTSRKYSFDKSSLAQASTINTTVSNLAGVNLLDNSTKYEI